MSQLFLEIENKDDEEIFISVQSFLALFTYRFLNSPKDIQLHFVSTNLSAEKGKIPLRSNSFRKEFLKCEFIRKNESSIQAVRDLRLPIYSKQSNTYVAGMCAVCRELVLSQSRQDLLGFKEGSLLAPSEASIWTRYCEVDIVDAVSQMLLMKASNKNITDVPIEIQRFEQHLKEPVRVHNIYKLARAKINAEWKEIKLSNNEKLKKKTIKNSTPKEQLPIEHKYAEGIQFSISDLILYPCVRLILEHCHGMIEFFPLTDKWLKEIDTMFFACREVYEDIYNACKYTMDLDKKETLNIPNCETVSLFKSDPKRYKPKNRIYTDQNRLEAALSKISGLDLEFNSNNEIPWKITNIDWNSVEPNHEQCSALPKERIWRKRQQLENLASAALHLAMPNERIVDFCSGTGHLGILLAKLLPKCTIILMENKAVSLNRAKIRAKELHLKNCIFYQCNIDYFQGDFNLGLSLHACGSASDIVLQHCQRSRAKFVCCPCCYGALQPMPHISYPLSKKFRSVLNEKDFLHISHSADQAHQLGTVNCKDEIIRQGQLCMDIIDTDRKLRAEEFGYSVTLTRLKPECCTPKNHLLIGNILTS